MLISFKEIPETRENFLCIAFRWTFQISRNFIGFIHQAQSKDGKWRNSHVLINGIWYHGTWMWGVDHTWYDGPHCTLMIGPIRIQWYNENCKECNIED